MRSVTGAEEVVSAVEHAQKRVTTWEAVVLGPLFGTGMSPVTGEAAERESATLLDAGLSPAQVQQLHGGRRALRVQPAKALIDFDGDDLVVNCELPEEAAITSLLDELIKPQVQVDG